MNTPTYRVSFTVTVDDVVAYLRLAQRTLNLIGAVLGLFGIVVGIVSGLALADAVTGVWLVVLGLVIFAGATTEFLDRWRARRVARSILGTESIFTFDETGIAAQTVTGSGRVPWSAVTELKKNDRLMLIRRDRLMVAWIPTRAFGSAEEQTAVEALIRNHIGRGVDSTT
jgi:hypothetical protein